MVRVHPSLTPKQQQLLKGENVTCAFCNPPYLSITLSDCKTKLRTLIKLPLCFSYIYH